MGALGCLERGEGEGIRNEQQPQGQSEGGSQCFCLSVPVWGIPGPVCSPDGVPSLASKNSLAVKGKQLSHGLHNWEKRRPPEPSGCQPTFGIKVEQRIPGGEHGLDGEETGSSEQQQGQPGRCLAGGSRSQGPRPGGLQAFFVVQSTAASS